MRRRRPRTAGTAARAGADAAPVTSPPPGAAAPTDTKREFFQFRSVPFRRRHSCPAGPLRRHCRAPRSVVGAAGGGDGGGGPGGGVAGARRVIRAIPLPGTALFPPAARAPRRVRPGLRQPARVWRVVNRISGWGRCVSVVARLRGAAHAGPAPPGAASPAPSWHPTAAAAAASPEPARRVKKRQYQRVRPAKSARGEACSACSRAARVAPVAAPASSRCPPDRSSIDYPADWRS